MARGGINKVLVKQARQTLLARGENPSLDALRIELGNTGSKTTIHRYLKELEAAEAGRLSAAKPLSDQLTLFVAQLSEQLQDEANEAVTQAHERWTQERTEYVEKIRQAEIRIQQQGLDTEILENQLKEERQAHHQAVQQLQQAQIENARQLQANQDLMTRLADRDEQIRSLEEKHQHARDGLEHYREAVLIQREQELRRNETKAQQLQMEIRQLQQALMVKQDDITQLNRDNERLLTEARLLQKEKACQQESIKQQTIEIAVLNTRLTQSQTNLIYIQEHASTLGTDNDELRQIISAQTLSASSLADSLAKANLELRKCMKSKMPANKNK